jgi:hypothetical protein
MASCCSPWKDSRACWVARRDSREERAAIAERIHTRYDRELGWINIPNLFVRDMYGTGVSLRTNAQGFRNDHSFEKNVPAGRLRVICSGDSFTLGYGVANSDAWCNLLETIDARIETVNMGQGGYGLDQAYLWYKRDGTKVEHNIQLFAFIESDFDRMRSTTFLGYSKPRLTVTGGELSIADVPAAEPSWLAGTIRSLRPFAGRLRTVQLLRGWALSVRTATQTSAASEQAAGATDRIEVVAEKVFESLRDLHAQRGSVLVLIYLPVKEDYGAPELGPWRRFAHDAAERLGIPLFDLVPDLNEVALREVDGFFIKVGELPYRYGEGHYTVRGNRFIAETIYRKLLMTDPIASLIRPAAH